MKELKSTLRIQASRQAIWAILMNTQDYPNWNPYWIAAVGDWTEGERIRFQQAVGGRAKSVRPKVLKKMTHERLEWQRKGWLGSFTCWEQLILLSEDAEQTVVKHHIYHGGWGSRLASSKYQAASQAFLEALKTEAEQAG